MKTLAVIAVLALGTLATRAGADPPPVADPLPSPPHLPPPLIVPLPPSGFVDLARNYLFPGDARPFAVLGARLPLRDGR